MASKPVRSGYNSAQRVIHWLTVIIVAAQIAFGDSVSAVERAMREGRTPDGFDAGMANAHFWGGISVLTLTVLRLVIRHRDGVPPPLATGLQARLATASHHLFYVLLILMPLTGLVAWYVLPAAGAVHELGKPVLIVLIAVHVAAALWHHFVTRDTTLTRMLRGPR
ncbi:cytochrome b [Methylobrevis albus]|uniref:Cytochrome b n=1 Tax=Methylobrevis albus TaxID=2793297 RepID=A0A931MW81_9HYPH|nr:cytochrome b [Methylobrevis albus]MBH0236318.1 cytochrome b [Methylobrevis albus]